MEAQKRPGHYSETLSFSRACSALPFFPQICPSCGECSAIPKTAGGTTTYPWNGKEAEAPLSRMGLRMLRLDFAGGWREESMGMLAQWHDSWLPSPAVWEHLDFQSGCCARHPGLAIAITRGLPQLLPMSSLFCFHSHSPSVLKLHATAFLSLELPNNCLLYLFLIFSLLSHSVLNTALKSMWGIDIYMADRIISNPFTQVFSPQPGCLILFVSRLCQHFLCFSAALLHQLAEYKWELLSFISGFHSMCILIIVKLSQTQPQSLIVLHKASRAAEWNKYLFTRAAFCYLLSPLGRGAEGCL